MKSLNEIFNNFGFATLRDVHILQLREGKKYGGVLSIEDFNPDACIKLETLKLCNIKEKGAKHTFKAGEFNVPIRRIGNTITVDIKDALGKIETLMSFFNFDIDGQRLYKSHTFTKPFGLEGKVEIINTKGIRTYVYIFIPCFLPTGTLEIQTSIEQEFGVFDLSGEIFPVFFNNINPHLEWYSISPYSIFDSNVNLVYNQDIVYIAHSFEEPMSVEKDNLIYNRDIVEMIPALNNELPFISDEEAVTVEQIYDAGNDYYNSFIMDEDQVVIDLNENIPD